MSDLNPKNRFSQFLYDLDCRINAGCYSAYDWLCRTYSAYSAFIGRWRVRGPKRVLVDLVSDSATFGLIFAIGLIYYAVPPIFETEDMWDRGRQYSVTFTDANGTVIGRRGIWQDDAIPLDEIPPHLIRAVLATEDARFYEHFGIDIQGTMRAMVENMKAQEVVQGGSSITQQVAKNLFLTPERTLRRKMHEAFLSLWIEARLTKNEILKLYLDRSYLGGGTYGVEAASQFYFGKSVRDVNLSEAAMLAGLFKAPSNYAPHIDSKAAEGRAKVVLYRMLDVGYISQGELFAAQREPAVLKVEDDHYSPDWFLDWAYEETLKTLRKHRLESEYVVEVKTTVDMRLQRIAQESVNKTLDENGKAYRTKQAALVSMDTTGAVKAIVGGRDYEDSQFNRATEAKRQPGSSFKPIIYLSALASGLRPNSVIVDRPITIGKWTPRNYSGGYYGAMTLASALTRSINTVAVQLAHQHIGIRKLIQDAKTLGLEAELRPNPSMPLGTNEVTVMDLTGVYATFASGGKLTRPYGILEIARPNGEVLYNREQNAPKRKQVVQPSLVRDLNSMLNLVVEQGTGRRARLGFTPQGGKTGTTSSYRDAWFVGFTAHYVTGVWFGNDNFQPTGRVTGGSLPAMTWHSYMSQALETKVAAALPGIPLEGQYAAYVDPDLSQVEPEFIDEIAEGLIEEDGENTVTTINNRGGSDAVVRVFQNMFSLFNEDQPRVQRRRNVYTTPGNGRYTTNRRQRQKRPTRFNFGSDR